jgi:hypothetical protein
MLIYPMFAMFLLTFAVLVISFRTRVRAVKDGTISFKYFRTFSGENPPDDILKPVDIFQTYLKHRYFFTSFV